MDITEIKNNMIGKKITCYIKDTFIEDGEITKEEGDFLAARSNKNKNDWAEDR